MYVCMYAFIFLFVCVFVFVFVFPGNQLASCIVGVGAYDSMPVAQERAARAAQDLAAGKGGVARHGQMPKGMAGWLAGWLCPERWTRDWTGSNGWLLATSGENSRGAGAHWQWVHVEAGKEIDAAPFALALVYTIWRE